MMAKMPARVRTVVAMTGQTWRERRWWTAMSGLVRFFSIIQKAAKDATVPARRARVLGAVQPAAEPPETK
ncbi:hypothetical protein D9M72_621810 [compost metagenome]